MKKLLTILALFGCIYATDAKDIRIVGNVHVDLTPIHQWEDSHAAKKTANTSTNKADERPMKHWKDIQITRCDAAAPWPICVISIEGEGTKQVYMKNASLSLMNSFNEDARLLKAMADKGQWIDSETKRLRDVGAHESEWEYGSPNYVRYQQDLAYLANQQDALSELHEQWKLNYETIKSSKQDLAMFTGQIYNRMEVWDMGQKIQQ